MTNRLFVFGCSYTYYSWPTWAALLSTEYDYYENWGWVGLGNRAIAERVAEAHALHNFNENDTVIVQWTTTLRHDWHNRIPINGSPGWQTNGNVFSPNNYKFYDRLWYDRFFSEESWVMHTLNHIILTQGLLASTNCKWKMTGLGDIRKLGTDLEQDTWNYERVTQSSKETTADSVLDARYPHFKNKSNTIWNGQYDCWIEPIMPTATKYDELYWWFQAAHDKEPWKEGHPSPLQHQKWLNEQLRPALGHAAPPSIQQEIIDEAINLKRRTEFMDCLKFEKFLLDKNSGIFKQLQWPPIKQGY